MQRRKHPSFNRRRWIYYIGLREQDDSSAQLFYAKCYYDHMAGSVSVPKPVEQIRDPFPDPLFFNDHVQCMCGKYPLPLEACVLSHTTLPRFINYLQDDTRRIPLILITCPWRISPEILQDKMIGNAIIFWCEDSSVVMRLNSILPKNMYAPWESVRVFVPLTGENVFHPLYTCDDIRASGDQALATGLIQAFCQSFRSDAMLIASVVGSVVLLALRAVRKDEQGREYPFAPFIVAGMLFALFFGDPVINWYLGLIFG